MTLKAENLDLTSFNAIVFLIFEAATDDTAKGGLIQYWKLFAVIPCAPTDFKR